MKVVLRFLLLIFPLFTTHCSVKNQGMERDREKEVSGAQEEELFERKKGKKKKRNLTFRSKGSCSYPAQRYSYPGPQPWMRVLGLPSGIKLATRNYRTLWYD